jgi:asparagine synthase (glutamine-hydrolysing)
VSLPPALKIADGWSKVVLREALGDMLPSDVRKRRDKLGFATPEAEWLRRLGGPLVEETLRHAGRGVDRDGALGLWSRVRNGDASAAAPLWRVVCFERWRETFGVS